MSDRTTITKAPGWATKHEIDAGGIYWSREATVATQASVASLGEIHLGARMADELSVSDDGTVNLVRPAEVEFYLEDQAMTLAQAREMAETMLSILDAVEAAS